MDTLSKVLSTTILLSAALCYQEAMTPPTAKADKSIRVDVESRVKRLFSGSKSRTLSGFTKYALFSPLTSNGY